MDAAAYESAVELDDRWSHRLGHLLWDVSTRVRLLGEAELADSPLTLPSLGLLDQIGARPGITITEITQRLPKTQQSISQVVARLDSLGYVERRLGAKRRIGLHTTKAGEQARARGQALELALEQDLKERFGEKSYEQLRELLEAARTTLAK